MDRADDAILGNDLFAVDQLQPDCPAALDDDAPG
jgi:hypothetical protein